MQNNPFAPAKAVDKKLKIFLYGNTGSGKTTFALQFPNPCVIDLERGTDLYGDKFNFEKMTPNTFSQTWQAVIWLMQNRHPYQTLVVDPVTMVYEQLQDKNNNHAKMKNKDHIDYDFGPKEWMKIKAEWKDFIRDIIALPMHVIFIAREKAKYDKKGFMKQIGETYDSEKNTAYYFDIVLRLVNEGGNRSFIVDKDRSNSLGNKFDVSLDPFMRLIGGVVNTSTPEDIEEMASKLETDTSWMDEELTFSLTIAASFGDEGEKKKVSWNDLYELDKSGSVIVAKDGDGVLINEYLKMMSGVEHKSDPLLCHKANIALKIFRERGEVEQELVAAEGK